MRTNSRRQSCAVMIALAAFAVAPLRADKPAQADRIVVMKSERKLMLLRQGKQLKTYMVALGGNPLGPKVRQGDNKTPEGEYIIDSRNSRSQFHLSLHISYPNVADREHARKLGVDPGGDIMIHGLPPQWAWLGAAHRKTDWTLGWHRRDQR